jgi:hypothetical protein
MARLASAAKGDYYPLPESVTPLIASHVTSPHGGRILDPCAGARGLPWQQWLRF